MNRNLYTLIVVPLVLAGCASSFPRPDLSTQNRIADEMARVSVRPTSKPQAPADAMPAGVLNALVQAPVGAISQPVRAGASRAAQRFDLVVTDAPIGQVLAGLVEGTEYSIMLKPVTQATGTTGATGTSAVGTGVRLESVDVSDTRVSFKLKNITLFEALDAIRDVYGYDYTVEDRRILVQPAELQTRMYYVNYILGQRRGVSDIQVIGGASVGSTSASGTSSFGSVQATGMSTTIKSDIWTESEDALRTLLGCNIPRATATTTVTPVTRAPGQNASRADVTYPGEPPMAERLRGVDGCSQGRALSINAMSGTILVRGMPTELRSVERLLRNMQMTISRQVIIESKIIDVELNNNSQQGINWSQFSGGLHRMSVGADPTAIGLNQPNAASTGTYGGTVGSTSTLANLLGTRVSPPGGALNSSAIALQGANFAALINFLESQGRVQVLSSPRIATLNNQKAVIKVGSEEPFVTNITGGTTTVGSVGTPTVVSPSLTYQPFFSGIALDVTPQIDADDNITLHVHSMVNRVVEKEKAALPGTTTTVPFAVNSMNETDSVVKARDGQVVVIGGLMSERNSDVRGGVPGVRDVPVAGGLFNWGTQQSTKRELVILLKPTVVKDDSAWAGMISETEERINGMKVAPRTPQ